VRRHVLSRWSIVLLLLTRLVLGEFAHGMPHHGDSAYADPVVATEPHELPCPDHAGEPAGITQSADSAVPTVSAHHGASHETDCCKTAACKCLCAHMSAVATPSLAVSFVLLDQSRVPGSAGGLMQGRLSVLFRPPA
jgi:hypothetical protein